MMSLWPGWIAGTVLGWFGAAIGFSGPVGIGSGLGSVRRTVEGNLSNLELEKIFWLRIPRDRARFQKIGVEIKDK